MNNYFHKTNKYSQKESFSIVYDFFNKEHMRAMALMIQQDVGPEGAPLPNVQVRNLQDIRNIDRDRIIVNPDAHNALHEKYNKTFMLLKNACNNYTFVS